MKPQHFIATTALLAAISLAPTACSKDKAGGGGGASAASAGMLTMLPKDSAGVVGISWAKARSSDLFKQYESKLMKQIPGEVAKIKTECGIDLVADINTVVVAGNTDTKKAVVAVRGSFDQAKVEACIVKMGGTNEGGVYTVEGEVTNAYWAGKDVVLLSEGLSPDQIKAASAEGSVKDNAPLMKLISKIDTSATIWAVGEVPPEVGSMMGAMGKAPNSGYLSLGITSSVKLKVGMIFDSAEDASSTKAMIGMGLSMAKGQPAAKPFKKLLDGISTELSDDTVVISAKITEADLTQLQGMGEMPF
tara:strand:+ start:1676 stop:2590 length:915 start_codon:yes stop_codon:yes gene_type:complete